MKWLLLLAAMVLVTAISDGKTLIVDPTERVGPKTLTTVMAEASSGDKIVLMPGSYPGIAINRSLSIIGSGKVVINGQGDSALIIRAPACRISNLSIVGSGTNPGIAMKSQDNILSNCSLKGGSVGFDIEGANNTIRDCQIDANLGIKLIGSKCTIQNNSLTGTSFGVTLYKSEHNRLAKNRITGQYISGLDIQESSANDILDNRVEGCRLGISLRQSDRNNLTNNSCISNELAGLYLNGSQSNRLLGNTLSKDGDGILLSDSEGNTIVSNMAASNTYGISLRGSGHNVLKNNSLKGNSNNLRIDSGNKINPKQDDFVQDIDTTNSADGRPICYLVGDTYRELHEGFGFVGLIGCKNVKVSNLTISNSGIGVLLVGSTACKVNNCTIRYSEVGISLINSKNCTVEKCSSESCKTGFLVAMSSDDRLEDNGAINSTETGIKVEGSSGLTVKDSRTSACGVGLSTKNSPLCQVLNCTASDNKDAGLELTSSFKCTLKVVKSTLNQEGISLVGSNDCEIDGCNVSSNIKDGISLAQLSGTRLRGNTASGNGQGVYVQSSKNTQISGNNLSANIRYGLRMSLTTGCNITDNRFIRNQITGINLVDCRGNNIYHNIFVDNGNQNAADNGDNRWDSGPEIGGNYWSDFKATGNPGDVPRQIPSKGVDRYPFQKPIGWS